MRSRIHAAVGTCLAALTLTVWADPERGAWPGPAGSVVHGQAAAPAAPAKAKPRPDAARVQTAHVRTARVETALDRYVAAPDDAFRYSVVATRPGDGHTAYVLEMVS